LSSPYGYTNGIATDAAGRFVYSAVAGGAVAAFSVGSGGQLTALAGQPYETGSHSFAASLAVFPPKRCCPAPVMSGAATVPAILWPPNGKLVPVTIQYAISTSCPSDCTIAVSSSEPGYDQWRILDSHHVLLRADRDGQGPGREYAISITCSNSAGHLSQAEVEVKVPHDQRSH
jgi:hypothetical protein